MLEVDRARPQRPPGDQYLFLFLPRSPFYHGAADDQHDEHAEPEECAKRRALLREHITIAHREYFTASHFERALSFS